MNRNRKYLRVDLIIDVSGCTVSYKKWLTIKLKQLKVEQLTTIYKHRVKRTNLVSIEDANFIRIYYEGQFTKFQFKENATGTYTKIHIFDIDPVVTMLQNNQYKQVYKWLNTSYVR